MKIVILECKRIGNRMILLGFLVLVLLFSACDSRGSLERYNVWDAQGISVSWKENLAGAGEAAKGLYLNRECMENLREDAGRYGDLNGENIRELLSGIYERKTLEELSADEMERFFRIRAERIYENLAADTRMDYTEEELAALLDSAKALSALSLEYAEGWKVLAEKMGRFSLFIVILTAVMVLQLFGRDSAVQMEELVRSGRYGKRQLDRARIGAAFLTASVLYAGSMMIYFFVMLFPFGFAGAKQPIQSNVRTFFSLYNITYRQQFIWNLLRGYVVLIFMVSLALIVTIVLQNILASGSVIAFFLVMLAVFQQVYLYPVNHWFANFMPLRMTDFQQFYLGNELYRIGGFSISCMRWSIIVSLSLSAALLAVGWAVLCGNRKRGWAGSGITG